MNSVYTSKADSRIFAPYRTLGLCSNKIPLCTHFNTKQRETYAITCIGRAFHSYKCSNFGLTWISDCHNSSISCMASDDHHVFTGCENRLTAFFHGGKVAHRFTGHEQEIVHLLPMGRHLLSADISGIVRMWEIATEELCAELSLVPEAFELTALCHPITYVNKVLFGSRQGSLELWNVKSLKQLYKFSGWNSAVTVLEPSPAVNIVAVGLSSGAIVLHNIRSDETLLQFTHDDGAVASISFRTDEGFTSFMLTGSQMGHIAVWNLEKRQLVASMRNAHTSVVSGLRCIDGEPLVLSSSPDNSLKLWVFDQPDSSGRLLRERSGHSAPLTCIKFHEGECARNNPDNTTMILSTSLDGSLRTFSPFSDADNRSLGRASYNRKQMRKAKGEKKQRYLMPPIIQIASEAARQNEWDSIVCCHEQLPFATTWNLGKWTMGSHRFFHNDNRKSSNVGIKNENEKVSFLSTTTDSLATSCAMSPCGNFAIIGYDKGFVDVFNIQSGIYRGCFTPEPTAVPSPPAHCGPVRGIAVDAVNSIAVTADGSFSGSLCFWRFRGRSLITKLEMNAPVSKIVLCRDSSLLAVALDDFRIVVVDIELQRIVRELKPAHSAPITGLTFSPDGRWLVSCSMDSTIRTWDLPTSCLVDCFVTSKRYPPMGVALSPVGDFLASIHRDQLGVSLWTNRALFDFVSLHPPLSSSDVELKMTNRETDLPATEADSSFMEPADGEAGVQSSEEVDGINKGLLKLSLEPETKWFSLFNLDIIRERNKPRVPVQKPVNVPFFLPTVPGLEPHLAVAEKESPVKPQNKSDFASLPLSNWTSNLAALNDSATQKDYCAVFDKLRSLGPSAVDLELRLLSNDDFDSEALGERFLNCIKCKLLLGEDFDLAIAYLARFIKVSGHTLLKRHRVSHMLAKEVLPTLSGSWDRVRSTCDRSLAVISFAKAPLVL